MKKYTFFLGLNDKDTKLQILSTHQARSHVMRLLADYLRGGTVTATDWVYKHDDGTIVFEESLKIETLGFIEDEHVFKEFALKLKNDFNQESVLMEVSEVEASFI